MGNCHSTKSGAKTLEERVTDLEKLITRMDSKMQSDVYPIVHKKGFVILLVNSFQNSEKNLKKFERKEAAESDEALMKRLWEETLGCEFHVRRDQTAREMKNILKEVANTKGEYDFLTVIISTHGGVYAESVIEKQEAIDDSKLTRSKAYEELERSQAKAGDDGEKSTAEVFFGDDFVPVREREIKKLFFNTHVTSALHEKPKFFILDYCRGHELDSGLRVKASGFVTRRQPEVEISSLLPSVSDVLVAYATHPEFVAWEHESRGSWLISAIAEIFEANYVHCDVVKMLTMVNKLMKGKIAKICDKKKYSSHKAMSVFESSLDKDFYLVGPPPLVKD